MKIKSIRLHPFAGIADKTYTFKDDLTIICGPNEEGKSTVAKAIQKVLFLPTKLTPAKLKVEIQDLLPLSGGDTICITFLFTSHEQLYTLEKKWGATNASQLIEPDGNITTNSDWVQEKLLKILPGNQAVVEQVLIASQSKLADAVNSLTSDVHGSLSDKLRSAILHGGGISGTELQDKINKQVTAYFGRWDDANEKNIDWPGRNFANPWLQDAGLIVKAWYNWQRAVKAVVEVEEYEIESNRLQLILNEVNVKLKESDEYLRNNVDAYAAVNKRISLDNEIDKFQRALNEFTFDATRWPVVIAEKKAAENESKGLNEAVANLDQELKQSRQKNDAQKDFVKLQQVNQLNAKLIEAEKTLRDLPLIDQNDLNVAISLDQNIRNSHAIIDGQKLLFKADVTVQGSFEITHSGGQNEVVKFNSGEKITRDITGGIGFNWQGVEFSIRSANADIATIETNMRIKKQQLSELLNKYGSEGINDLKTKQERFQTTQQNFETAKSNLDAALGGETIEELKSRCGLAQQLPGTRDISILENLLAEAITVRANSKNKIDTLTEESSLLEEKHETPEKLQQYQVSKLLSVQQKQEELKSLSALPTGHGSALGFQIAYNDVDRQQREYTTEKHETELNIGRLVQPQQTLSEAREQQQILRQQYESVLAKGRAYKRIQQVLQSMMDSADANAFQPLHNKTEEYLSRLSGGRFISIPFDLTKPQKLKTDLVELPVHLLSKGTKDILALSLRLAAADLYLENLSGFVVMDDPLVDMDNSRNKVSATLLNEFAENHQTIIFTCHEAHAELLKNA